MTSHDAARTPPADAVHPADPDAFRSAIGRLPAGVAVVTLRWRGVDHAMTASAVASVSLEPPLVLFCVHEDARFREALDHVDRWALSVLADTAAPVADWLASPGRPAVGQLIRVPHTVGAVSGAPLVQDSAAWFECRTSAIHRAGDHDVVVGEVLTVGQGRPDAGGLVHLRGRMRAVR